MAIIRFRFSPEKALAALHWMVREQQPLDLHAGMKGCYFADREHLNKYNRPVFGATYRAMKFGPVPLEIYEMAKGEALWLAEVEREGFPWELHGYRLSLTDNRAPDMSALSDTDMAALESGFAKSTSLGFNARTAATHGRDWQRANLGIMSYEDMIDDTPEKPAIIKYLEENARFMRL